ncbi:MAG TPA: NADH-quinone oxidoreductase subunit N [Candidatus Binatia bacterium]|nr:NADH-quinone oxidoreductase subunit N [Candidatus Binatia bacterium]
MNLPSIDWAPLLPVLAVTTTALAVLIVDLFMQGPDRDALAWLAVLGLAVTAVISAVLWGHPARTLNGTFVVDDYAVFFNLLFCTGSILTTLMAVDYLATTGVRGGEYYALVLFATAGMMTMAAGTDLIVIFLGLEVMSIAVYVLAGVWRQDVRSNEAALKYFLLGAFATGFLLFGIALVYGATGSTHLDTIATEIGRHGRDGHEMLLLGAGLLIIGFGFKVAAVPFHVWTPDVYEGAPTSVTALMAVGVKAAAFAAFARVFLDSLASARADWSTVLWWLAAATMTVGNLLAITQSNIKRMLAYSSIAHAGYLLVAMVAGGKQGGAALLFYLLAYTAMNLGAFGVVVALARRGEPNETIDRYAGLGFRRPILALAMAVFMLSLAGVPPLVGFAGKFYVFRAAVDSGYVGLAVIGVLNSVVSAYYYIWIIVTMYMREGEVEPPLLRTRPYLAATIGIAFAATVLLGVFPGIGFALARGGFFSLG